MPIAPAPIAPAPAAPVAGPALLPGVAPASTPSQYGNYTKDGLVTALKTNTVSVPAMAKNNTTAFEWNPASSQYFTPRGADPLTTAPIPSLPDRQQIAQQADPLAGVGSNVIYRAPIQTKEAVKHLALIPIDKPSNVSSLQPAAAQAYADRVKQQAGQGLIGRLGSEYSIAGSEIAGAINPAVQGIEYGMSKITGSPTTQTQIDSMMQQKINDLQDQADNLSTNPSTKKASQNLYQQARDLHDQYQASRIRSMSDLELSDFDTAHPVLQNMTSTLAQGSMQFVALNDAPFMGALSKVLSGGFTDLLTGSAKLSNEAPLLVKAAAKIAGALPANFVWSTMNFDFENKPLSQLPAKVATDLAVLVPLELGMSAAGAMLSPMSEAVIKSATKVAAMARALRIPLGRGAGQALEEAAMNQSDNAFSRILSALPEDQNTLRDYFGMKNSFMSEDGVLMQKVRALDPAPEAENRLINLSGAEPEQPIERTGTPTVIGKLSKEVPEIDLKSSYRTSMWFKNMEETMTEKETSVYDKYTPVKNLPKTYAMFRQLDKIVETETSQAQADIKDFFSEKNFNTPEQEREFVRYATLQHMAERSDAGISNGFSTEFNIPNNPNIEWTRAEIAKMEAASPELKIIADRARPLLDKPLYNAVEAQQLTKAQADLLRAKYPNYTPFFYDKWSMTNDSSSPFASKSWNFQQTDRMLAASGGDGLEMQTNLYDAMMRTTAKSVSDKYINTVAQMMREEAGMTPLKVISDDSGRKYFQAIVDGQFKQFDAQDLAKDLVPGLEGQRVLFSQHDGNAFLAPKQWAELIQNEKPELSRWAKIIAPSNRVWETLTTASNPSFAIESHPIKMMASAIRYTKHGIDDFIVSLAQQPRDMLAAALFKDLPETEFRSAAGDFQIDDSVATAISTKVQVAKNFLADIIGPEGWQERMQLFEKYGGSQGTFAREAMSKIEGVRQYDVDYANAGLASLPKRVWMMAKGGVAFPFKRIADVTQFLDAMMRKSEFDLTMKLTGDAVQAGLDASDVTQDFRMAGRSEWVKEIQAISPYTNAEKNGLLKFMKFLTLHQQVYGADGALRNMTLQEMVPRAVLPSIPLTVAAWSINHLAGAATRLPSSIRDNYWAFYSGHSFMDAKGQPQPIYITIPKSPVDRIFTPIIDATMDALIAKKPEAFHELGQSYSLGGIAQSAAARFLPPVAKISLEALTNHDFFYGQDIVPPNLKGKSMLAQSFKTTSPIGRMVGNAMGLGGIMGDHILRESAPAIFQALQTITKPSGEPDLLRALEYMKMAQTPNTWFTVGNLEQNKISLIYKMEADMKDRGMSREDKAAAIAADQAQINAADELIKWNDTYSKEHPLQQLK